MKFRRTRYIRLVFVFLFAGVCQQAIAQDKTAKSNCSFYFHKELGKNVYVDGDSLPGFTGGQTGYMRFLNKNLRVPEEISENQEIIPLVMMEFIVDEKGKLNCISLNDKRDTSSFVPMEKEVFRLLHLMPEWVPGTCNGMKVPMKIKRAFLGCIKLEYE